MNILPCTTDKTKFTLEGMGSGKHTLKGDVTSVKHVGVRPEHITLGKKTGAQCSGIVDLVEYLGADTFIYVNCGHLGTLTIRTGDIGKDIKGEEVSALQS